MKNFLLRESHIFCWNTELTRKSRRWLVAEGRGTSGRWWRVDHWWDWPRTWARWCCRWTWSRLIFNQFVMSQDLLNIDVTASNIQRRREYYKKMRNKIHFKKMLCRQVHEQATKNFWSYLQSLGGAPPIVHCGSSSSSSSSASLLFLMRPSLVILWADNSVFWVSHGSTVPGVAETFNHDFNFTTGNFAFKHSILYNT